MVLLIVKRHIFKHTFAHAAFELAQPKYFEEETPSCHGLETQTVFTTNPYPVSLAVPLSL